MRGPLWQKWPWLKNTKLHDATVQVLARTNCGSAVEAKAIADAAVAAGLAACANIHGPIASVYRWQGELAEAEEWVVELKTVERRLLELMELVKARHSYDLPAFYVLPVTAGHADYLSWIARESVGEPAAG